MGRASSTPRFLGPLTLVLALGMASAAVLHTAGISSESVETVFIFVLGGVLIFLSYLVRRSLYQLKYEKLQLHTLVESLAEGVVILDASGRVEQCNVQARKLLNATSEELLGKSFLNGLEWQTVRENGSPWQVEDHSFAVTLRVGESVRDAIMGVRKNGGDLKWLKVNSQAVQDKHHQTSMVVVSFTDITSTRQQMDRLDLTIVGAGLGTWDWNIATGSVVFNDIWAHMLGYELSEVAPDVSSWARVVDPAAGAEVMSLLNDHLAGRTSIYRSEHRLRRKDGSWMWVLDTGRVVERDPEGKPLRALGVHIDITSTKEMERRLRESDQQFLTIFDQTAHLLWVLSPDGLIKNANQAAIHFSNVKLVKLIGHRFWESTWLSESTGWQATMKNAIHQAAAGELVRFDLAVDEAAQDWTNAAQRYFDFTLKPVFGQDGCVTSLVAEALDITESIRNREVLRVARERLVYATRSANLGVWDWNPITDEAWFNEQWFSMLGYADNELPYVGQTWVSLMHPADSEMTIQSLTRYLSGDLMHQQVEFRLEFRMRRRDGSYSWIMSVGRVTERDENGRPTRVSGVHFDETERRRLQSQRAQAQRLESIGQLAAGVAHEINTPMQFVSDNLEYLVEGIESADKTIAKLQELVAQAAGDSSRPLRPEVLGTTMRETGYERFRQLSDGAVRDCRDGCQRVVTIVHAMRQLSHPGTDSLHSADLNEIINGAVTVTRNRWKFVADVRLELDPDMPAVPCRAAELSQVLVNMIVNAADAVGEPEPGAELTGVITIRTQISDQHAIIAVQDNGSGIPPQVIDRIFDPFFTTKPVGQGTGQGLAIAHDIVVNRHHGSLRVESEPGKGTTFFIELPLVQMIEVASESDW